MKTPKQPFINSSSSSFRALRESGSYLVDKSLFIRDLIDAETSILIARPRRFGKTTNLQMAHEFFRIDRQDQAELFKGMKILEDEMAIEHMGKYPVIFLDLKGWQAQNLAELTACMAETMSEAVIQHFAVLPSLLPDERRKLEAVMASSADSAVLKKSLLLLCKALEAHHKTKPIILIDEYDAPIHKAFGKGFYTDAIDLIRPWLSDAFKTNDDYLFKGVLTGILRISKESLFSGLNNIEAYTTLRHGRLFFLDKFGFTEDEVVELLRTFGKEEHLDTCRRWYNGYRFGSHTIYNPWSITHFAREDSVPQPWWVNTSQDALLWDQLAVGHPRAREEMQTILAGGSVRKKISEATHLSQLPSSDALWSLILFSGYLKASEPIHDEEEGSTYKLELPNREVFEAFRTFVHDGFARMQLEDKDLPFQLLAEDRLEDLEESLRELFLACASYHDLNRVAESFVHGVFFGICIHLRKSFLIRSNVETGRGRADILLIPRDPASGFSAKILEIKIAQPNESLEQGLEAAFTQIEKRDYAASIREAGCAKILNIGIAVKGKDIALAFKPVTI